MNIGKTLYWSGLVLIFVLSIAVSVGEGTGKIQTVCIDEVTVQTIDKVTYRTAHFTSTDGRQHSIGQPKNLHPGAIVCLRSTTVYNW